jgi:hypothetical protein
MQVEIAWKERREWHIRVQLQPAPAEISTPVVERLSYTGLIDVHSHVLWGLDDGSVSIEDSLAMLRSASEHGTAVIVATPHSNAEYPYQQESIEARILELIAHSGGNPRLLRGCDFHLSFDNIDVLLDQPSKYTINGKQYLLVECPDSSVGRHTESVFNRLLDARIVPIVTHPERNPILQRKLSRVEVSDARPNPRRGNYWRVDWSTSSLVTRTIRRTVIPAWTKLTRSFNRYMARTQRSFYSMRTPTPSWRV